MPYAGTKEQKNARRREARVRDPDRVRQQERQWKYGITQDEFEALWSRQGEACGACGTKEPGNRSRWMVDHCHVTGRVRGILCTKCNVALGMVDDSPDRLFDLVNYLRGE